MNDAHSTSNSDDSAAPELDRYSRQMLYANIGEAGQRRLLEARVCLIGCGALGTVLAETLARAGVGHLRICDRDYIEPNNLQRQVLFDEDDIADALPKAEAAARKLAKINSGVTIEPVVCDVSPSNVERLADGADLLLDGTDNFETRFLINDLAVKSERPWIYGAVIGATGLVMVIQPGQGPCLRCVFDELPPPEMNPTCDTAGVIGPAVNIVASLQAVEAFKLLTGQPDQVNRHLISVDAWSGRLSNLNVQSAYEKGDCRCCRRREFEFLEGDRFSRTAALCGRDAVQVFPTGGVPLDFLSLAKKLQPVAEGDVRVSQFMLRATLDGFELTLFADGRAIIKGTSDTEIARGVYARFVGA